MLTVENGTQDSRQRSLTPSAATRRDDKVLAENLCVAGAKAPIDLSARLLIHASDKSPRPRYLPSANRVTDSTGGEDLSVNRASKPT